MSMESEAHDLLMQRLDDELRQYSADVIDIRASDGLPFIANIYLLQDMAEVHCLLKTVHPFTPQEVNALLKFKEPLAVARACWEQNTEKYSFDICQIIKDNNFERTFAPANLSAEQQEKPSLREQLQTAMREARKQARTEPAPPKLGGEPR